MMKLVEFRKAYPVTAGLLGLMVGVYLVMNLVFPFRATSNEAIFAFGGLFGTYMRVDPSHLWRLLTSNVVHIGFQHLLMNGLSLYIVGKIAEQIWRPRVYLTLFILAGVFGGLLTLVFAPHILSAGASSSIFGLFAGVAVLGYFGSSPLLKQAGRSFQVILLVNLISNLFMTGINIWGHLGGAIGGGLCAIFLPNQLYMAPFTKMQKKQALLVFACLSLVMFGWFYR